MRERERVCVCVRVCAYVRALAMDLRVLSPTGASRGSRGRVPFRQALQCLQNWYLWPAKETTCLDAIEPTDEHSWLERETSHADDSEHAH
jgi:hypothetical protein